MNPFISFRPASEHDVPALHRLITENLEAGHLLPRTTDELTRHAHRFVVAHLERRIIGCAELAPLSDTVAEVRSLVVDEVFRGQQIGTALVSHLSIAATARGFATLCAFTHDPSHFVGMGFTIVPHVWVPEKIARDCTSCALFRRCGQYAVTLPLRAGATVAPEYPVVLHAEGHVPPRRRSVERLQVRLGRGAEHPEEEAIPA